jgi:hypothetical protein
MKQSQIDWFLAQGVTIQQLTQPSAPIVENRSGTSWLYFYEDDALWQPKTGDIFSSWNWCLGHQNVEPDKSVTIHASPLDWLRDNRQGIVIIDWSQAFDMLYRLPFVRLPAALRDQYDEAMQMPKLPELEIV